MSSDVAPAMRFVDLPGGWTVGQFPGLAALGGFAHAASTRIGPDGASLRHDDPNGPAHRMDLARAIGAKRCACVRQVHGSIVVDAAEAMTGSPGADAMMTDRPGVALLGLSGDCPIVLVADPARGAVGMAHASWRSTVGQLSTHLVAAMREAYLCDPADLRAAICPSAGPCCYEVGDDVVAAVEESLGDVASGCIMCRDGATYFDLWAANVQQLTEAGLIGENIEVAGICTICDNRFFSYRREGVKAGRHGGLIARA